MRIMTYNVNGIRARAEHVRGVLEMFEPDVIGLQETKVADDEFPMDLFDGLDYHVEINGQKGHYGVATLSKFPVKRVDKGFPGDGEEAQRRIISTLHQLPSGQDLFFINGYFPQGESRDHPVKFPAKEKFYKDLRRYLDRDFSPSDWMAVVGDMNIAPENVDVGIGDKNAKRWLRAGKTSFLPEEREWLGDLLRWGLHDAYRVMNPDSFDLYSWFDYRSRGFETDPKRGLRIDLLLVTKPLLDCGQEAGIDYVFRGRAKSSDHCPVWFDFKNPS